MPSGARQTKTHAEYTDLLAKLKDIPTLPMVAIKVNELINDPMSTGGQIAEVLKKDQVLTAKLLRLVNSSYYSIPGGVTDVQRALAFLGFNTLAQLVLGVSVFSVFQDKGGNSGFSMTAFWKHALGTAVCSEILAKQIRYPKPEEAFTCGLLHDIGKLALHEIDREMLFAIYSTAKEKQISFLAVEKEWEMPTHAYMGELIAIKWGLPQSIRMAIRYHHFDVTKMDSILPSIKPVIHVVRLANAICVKNKIGFSGDCSDGGLTPDMLVPFGMTMDSVREVEEILEKEMDKAAAFLSAYR